jgi:hypothetical protein
MKNFYMRFSFATLLLFSIGATRIAHAETRITRDGRFSTHCAAWASDTNIEMCWPTIYRLLARPEDYDEKLITLTGFLIRVDGDFLLFPSADRVAVGAQEDAIELLGAAAMADAAIATARKTKRYRNGAPVVVTGTFDAWYSGAGMGRAGAIREIKRVYLPLSIEPDPAN